MTTARWLGTLAVILALGCGGDNGPKSKTRTTEEKIALQKRFDEVKEKASADDNALAATLQSEAAKLEPNPEGTACPVDEKTVRAGRQGLLATLELKVGAARMYGPAGRAFNKAFPLFDNRLQETYRGEADPLAAKLEAFKAPAAEGYWFVMHVEGIRKAEAGTGDKFTAGAIVGTVFVWDAAKGKLICGAPTSATSSESVTVSRTEIAGQVQKSKTLDDITLSVDLKRNALEAAVANLKTVRPRAAKPADGTPAPPTGDKDTP